MKISENTAVSMPMRNLISIIGAVAVGSWFGFGHLPVPMRAGFSLVQSGGTPRIQNGQSGYNASSISAGLVVVNGVPHSFGTMACNASGLTLYRAHDMDAGGSAALVEFDAEL